MRIVLCLGAACLLPVLTGAGFVWAGSNLNPAGAIRSATTPPSSYQSGLVERPSSLDNSGNLLITGNVAGGKHFRGSVPYRSTTSIGAPLGSTTLDSFMRYTEPTDFGSGSQGYSVFYSPTGTVTAFRPEGLAASTPVAPGTGGEGFVRAGSGPAPAAGAGSVTAQTFAGTPAETGLLGFSVGARLRSGTAPVTSDEMHDIDSDAPASDQDQQQLRDLHQRLGQIQAGVFDLERSLVSEDRGRQAASPSEVQAPAGGNLSRRQELLAQTARLLSATIDLALDTEEDGRQRPQDAEQRPAGPSFGLRLYDPQRDSHLTLDAVLPMGMGTGTSAHAPLRTTDATSAQQAHETSVPVNSDSPLLASMPDPNMARDHLGKFQTLFAAGEFRPGALSLAKAIELDPKRALQRTDLISISGGPDAFIARFRDLSRNLQAGDTPQLQFLLAYICYQMERPEEARTAIDVARRGLPSSLAVEILGSAIKR
jgi:hypothetical protein